MRGIKRVGWKKYEGLFILDATAKEESTNEIIDKLHKEIERVGGRVETVQKMGQRPFARTTRKRAAGYYVNFIFQAPPKALAEMTTKFQLETDVFRWLFTEMPPEQPERKRRKKQETTETRG